MTPIEFQATIDKGGIITISRGRYLSWLQSDAAAWDENDYGFLKFCRDALTIYHLTDDPKKL